jgi:protein-disulfide isomerase
MATKKPKAEGVPVPTVVITVIVVFVVGLLIGKFTLSTTEECKEPTCPKEVDRYRIYPRGTNPSKGPRNAKVTVIEVTDFQNPLARVMHDTLVKLQKEHPKTVRLVFVNNPRTADGRRAAVAGLAAKNQNKFWQMAEKLFANPRKLTEDDLVRYAKQLGLNVEKFKSDLKNRRLNSMVAFDQRQVRRLGVRKTPAIFINGRHFTGKVPMNKLKKLVKEEEKAAEKLVAELKKEGRAPKGRKPNIYREFMRGAETSLRGRAKRKRDKRRRRRRPKEDPKAVYKVPVEGKPWKGTENALVTIVESSEFQCPFCSRVNPTIKKVMDAYKGKVKVVFHHNPLRFHKQAMMAAIASHEVFKQKGNKAFWEYHDKLFANQKKIRSEGRKFLEQAAKEVGVNMTKFKKALDEETHKQEIQKMKMRSRRLGARGTPTFFVNGRKLRGARPFPAFKALIDEELKKAEAAIAAGKATKQNYYATVMKKGLDKVKYLPGQGPDRQKRQRKRRVVDPTVVYKMPAKDKPAMGPETALVTVVVSMEYQCPFCKRVMPTLYKLAKEFPKDVRVVWHHNPLPFHKNAMIAAEAAHEAYVQKGDKGFWKFTDKLFEKQRELRTDARGVLEQVAKDGGLNMTKFKKALDTNKHKEMLEEQRKLANKLGARGTPASFINGKIFTGARPYQAFEQRVKQAIKEAKPLVSKAGGRKKLYEFIIKDGKTQAVYKVIGGNTPKGKPRRVRRRPPKIRIPAKGRMPRRVKMRKPRGKGPSPR